MSEHFGPRPAGCCGTCPPIAGGGYDCTCEDNPRCPVTAADRPSVTDNARAEAWDEGYNAGKNDLRDGAPFRTFNPYLAAGRAETTTEDEVHPSGVSFRWEDGLSAETTTATTEDGLAAPLLATARTRPTREHALKKAYRDRQQPIQEDDAWAFGEGVRAGVDAVLALWTEVDR